MHADAPLAAAVIAECRKTFASALAKVRNCLSQLSAEDLAFRPTPTQNSIAIIVNHLCGNVRQWIICPLKGIEDHRDRPAEFEDPGAASPAELLTKLEQAIAEVDEALVLFDVTRLLEPIRIQGFDITYLHALFNATTHFVGHQQEIVYITRTRLGDRYRFEWTPSTPEQGAPRQA